MRFKRFIVYIFIILFASAFIHTTEPINEKKESNEYQEISFDFVQNKTHKKSLYQVSVFPSSIIEIEEGALEGTALSFVNLPDTIEKIGDYAFANIPLLRRINISNKTINIGENAFIGSNQVIITGDPKSYASTWAEKQGIPFFPIDSFFAFENAEQIAENTINRVRSLKIILDEDIASDNSKSKQTGRLSSDITASRYIEFTAFHIQGRSPPLA